MHFVFMLQGVKCAQELSANALERVRRRVYEYDAQSKEKKSALKTNVRKKIIKDKNWSMLRKMFNESPPVRAIQICIFFCWIRIQYYIVFNKISFFLACFSCNRKICLPPPNVKRMIPYLLKSHPVYIL